MKRSITRFLLYNIFDSHMPEIIIWWHGTDVLKLYHNNIPGYNRLRIFVFRWLWKRMTKLTNLTCYVNTKKLKPYLKEYGFKKIIVKESYWERKKYKKKVHKGLNILFYVRQKFNKKYERWIYGLEYLNELQKQIDNVNWIVVDGSQDMTKIYPIIDCYVKVNRCPHSDRNKINKECAYNDIPERAFDVYDKSKEQVLLKIKEWIEDVRKI